MANEKRLVDANPIVQFIMDGLNNPDKLKALGHDAIEILAEIEYAPTVDAVEVVRCKDCEHWIPGDSMMGNSIDDMQRVGGCPYVRFRRLENEFCSYGERKE